MCVFYVAPQGHPVTANIVSFRQFAWPAPSVAYIPNMFSLPFQNIGMPLYQNHASYAMIYSSSSLVSSREATPSAPEYNISILKPSAMLK